MWTGTQAWLLGAQLYLPDAWLTAEARQRARIPSTVRFQEKWRLALTLLRQVRAAGFRITAVLGDAEFGENSRLRTVLHRAGLPYALSVSSQLTVFTGTPRFRWPVLAAGRRGRPRIRPRLAPAIVPLAVTALAAMWPARAWRSVRWRNATGARAWTARFAAQRVTPAHDWRRQRHPEVWLLAEQDRGATPRTKFHLGVCAAETDAGARTYREHADDLSSVRP